MRSRIRKALNVRANGPWILASALLVALMVAPFAGAFGEGNNVRGGARNPSPDARRAYTKETRDHRQRQHVRHPPVEQVHQRRRRRVRLPLGRGRHAEGQRALRARQQPGRRPRVRVQRQRRHRGRRHHRPGRGGPVHHDRQGRGHRPERRPGRRQERRRDRRRGAGEVRHRRPAPPARWATSAAPPPAARGAPGVYSVDFDADVSKCARTATDHRRRPPGVATTDGDRRRHRGRAHVRPRRAPRPTARSTSSSPASRLTTDRALARAPRRSARGARSGRPRRRRGGRPGR